MRKVLSKDCGQFIADWVIANAASMPIIGWIHPTCPNGERARHWTRRGKLNLKDSNKTIKRAFECTSAKRKFPNDYAVVTEQNGVIVTLDWLSREDTVKMFQKIDSWLQTFEWDPVNNCVISS